MPKFGYDTKNIEKAVAVLRQSPKNVQTHTRLMNELNKFFTEAKCVSVVYTDNKDKLFFGMMVTPNLTRDQVVAIMAGDKTGDAIKVEQYMIDIDSKLFDNLTLSNKEITAVLLHEVGHLVVDDSPAKIVRANMDVYFAKERESLDVEAVYSSMDLVKLALEDAMVKAVSLWYRDEEVAADSFVVSCGYGPELESALRQISDNAWGLAKDAKIPKYVMLYWALRVYKEMRGKRIPAIKTLDRAIDIEASTIAKNKMKAAKKEIANMNTKEYKYPANAIYDGFLDEAVQLSRKDEELLFNEVNAYTALKLRGLRAIEGDYYEYLMRINNVEDELDALQILREINSRLSILKSVMLDAKLSSVEKKKYEDLILQYESLRVELSKKKIWKRANYGLFYDYNAVDPQQVYVNGF